MHIEIIGWGSHYENYRTRELQRMEWVAIPNKMDGDGYTELLNHPNGAAHFGAWCALLQVASRCSLPTDYRPTTDQVPTGHRQGTKYASGEHPHGRGLLLRATGEPHDPTTLERMTRISHEVWEEVLPRLVSIGWIRYCDTSVPPTDQVPTGHRQGTDQLPTDYRPTTDAPVPTDHPLNGTERNGTEGGRVREPPPCLFTEMKAINPGVNLKAADVARIHTLSEEHGPEAILAAYQAHQTAKPGQALRFFFEDLGKYLPAKPSPRKEPTYPSTAPCPTCGEDCAQAPGEPPGTYVCRGCSKDLPPGEWQVFRTDGNGKGAGAEPVAAADFDPASVW